MTGPPQCQAKGGGDSSKPLVKTQTHSPPAPEMTRSTHASLSLFLKGHIVFTHHSLNAEEVFLNTQGPEVTGNVLSQFTYIFLAEKTATSVNK